MGPVMIIMMMRDLGKGGKGGVKTIRGFWLNHSIVKASVDWIPGVMIVTMMLKMTSGVVKMMTLVMMTVMMMMMMMMMMVMMMMTVEPAGEQSCSGRTANVLAAIITLSSFVTMALRQSLQKTGSFF